MPLCPVPPRRRPWSVPLALAFLCLVLPSLGNAQADGARKWAFSTADAGAIPGDILSSPSIGPDGTIYIAAEVGGKNASSGRVFAIAPDGTARWKAPFTTEDWIDSSPTVAADGTIYFGCWDGNLYALNTDGSKRWSTPVGSFVSGSPALAADGTVYVGTGAGDLYAVKPDGTVKWFFPTLYWIEASPAVAPDGTIYIGSGDNTFYAVNPNGTEKWHYTVGSDIASSAAIAADGTVYFGARDLTLYALSPSGALKWRYATPDMLDASPVIGPDGTVYAASIGGRVYALRPDGTLKWQYPAAGQPALGSIYSTPAIRADGSLVFGSSDNAIYALRADGTLLWTGALGDWADSSPAIGADGTIYIGCSDKSLYAFTGKVAQNLTDWPQFLRDPQRTGHQPFGAAAGTQGRLANMSVRTQAGAAENTLIVGFAIGGTGTRSLLVRGVGPTLTKLGVSGVLQDPSVTLYGNGASAPTATNDNWSAAANSDLISSTATRLGAFGLPAGSLDSAMLRDFGATAQTLHVTAAAGATGIALVELYDAGGNAGARLKNVSARSYADVGAGVLIAGFVVTENTRAVLIRGIGPRLTALGVPGASVLANPRLRVYRAVDNRQLLVADNDDWSGASLPSVFDSVGAFSLETGSRDAVMLLTLAPGVYTAQVSGAGDSKGVALVEVYEVP